MGQIDPLREVVKSRLRSHFIWKESGTGFNYLRNNWTIHYIEEEMESRVHSRLSRKQSRIAYFLFSKLFFYIKSAWIFPHLFVCFKGRLLPLPDRRVDIICSIPHSCESPLWTCLRGHGSETWTLIHFTGSLKQDWSTSIPLTPYQWVVWRTVG